MTVTRPDASEFLTLAAERLRREPPDRADALANPRGDHSLDDVPLVRQLIAELAVYERLGDAAVATDDGLREQLFGTQPAAEVL